MIDQRANPGAAATATGADSKFEAEKPLTQNTPQIVFFASFYWDRRSGSVERLRSFAGIAT
ncbi:hypothetical protein MGEO_18495 [Marivita geojedonensis]|uniref:Uncharacterized protein n=1 Tax=Marivita geojedonensis TaxID=1123756 RepID=A0A1X4NDG7_9RHOB|nr:hypothetical protein MGEO_18495 [Marivita geojedonensis]PRY73853.1 hypothetical protein CLV76_12732 [Marivita geojedonensis]